MPAVAGSIPKRASPTSVRPAPISLGEAEHLTAVHVKTDVLERTLARKSAHRDDQVAVRPSGRGIISPISRPTISAIAPCGVTSARGLAEIRWPS